MGLLIKLNNGDTQFKSLKFGKDRPGGGDSKQPYIKNPIKEDFKNPAFYNDFVIRGGILAPTSAAEDVVRLTKYFTDISNPSGILFAAKQNILSRVGTKTEANQPTPAYLGGALNEGVYLPTSTLAQALVGFAGTTLNKQGIDPTGLIPGLAIRKYQEAVYNRNQNQTTESSIPKSVQSKVDKINQNILKKQDQIDSSNANFNAQAISNPNPDSLWSRFKENRLNVKVNNLEDSIEGLQEDLTSIIGGKFSNRLLKLWDKFGLNPDNEVQINNNSTLFSYSGGPGSALGFSRTKIKFATSNDGVTPLRTGYLINDPYSGIGYLNYSPGDPLTYGLDPIFDGKQLYSSVFRQYQKFNPTVTEQQYFGVPTYFSTYDGKDSIQPWLSQPVNKPAFATWNQSQLNSQSPNLDSTTLPDFRQALDPTADPQYTFLSLAPNYQTENIEDKRNLGNPGKKGNISSYTQGKKSLVTGQSLGPVDKVNASYIYKANAKDGSRYYKGNPEGGNNPYTDIIPFYIAILNNDSQVDGPYKKYMHFRAFIDSFSDSYDADWKTIEYMGRAEKFYKYNSFDRKISMAFTIVAQSREEITAMYDKLNFLASSLAPEYLDSYTSGYMAGNIAYITLGDYLHEQPGIITSLTFDVPEEATWEIGIDDFGNPLNQPEDKKDVRQLPHMIKVSGINFIPLHKFRPEKQNFRNDKLGTNSTRLLSTGKQRYIDQQRPMITNYDKDAQDQFSKDEAAVAAAALAEQQRIVIQNNVTTGILVDNPTPTGISSVVAGGAEVTGLNVSNPS
jgi:hypothetical protein